MKIAFRLSRCLGRGRCHTIFITDYEQTTAIFVSFVHFLLLKDLTIQNLVSLACENCGVRTPLMYLCQGPSVYPQIARTQFLKHQTKIAADDI